MRLQCYRAVGLVLWAGCLSGWLGCAKQPDGAPSAGQRAAATKPPPAAPDPAPTAAAPEPAPVAPTPPPQASPPRPAPPPVKIATKPTVRAAKKKAGPHSGSSWALSRPDEDASAPAVAPSWDEGEDAAATAPAPAEAIAETAGGDPETHTLAPSMASETPAIAPPVTAAQAADPPPQDYKVMTVFYGTDRNEVEYASDGPTRPAAAFAVTMGVAGLTVLLAAIVLRMARPKRFRLLASAAALGALLCGGAILALGLGRGAPPSARRLDYGSDRGELALGTCRVSIPAGHREGKVERPSLFRLEVREDPHKHVVVLDVRRQDEDEFFAALKAKVAGSQRKQAMVFVHGYNVTFDAAARRTAQLAYDLEFDGAAAFFSWPSQGALWGYTVDETNVAWAVPHLKQFLLELARKSQADSVHLVAHSMGNRALTAALSELALEIKEELPIFHEVVLTAPDIDAAIFRRDIAPKITQTARRVTLYASSNDEALSFSKKIHGYARAGESGGELVVVPGVDTIDVSTVDTSLMGHSYFSNNDTVLSDLISVLNKSLPPPQRPRLEARQLGAMLYWAFIRGGPLSAGKPSPGPR